MRSFMDEVRGIFKSRKVFIPIVAILFIPLLYSGMLLYAFWDPYGKLEELPVAVVNLDEGANYESKQLAIGNDLVEKLKENPKFKWEFADEKKAEQGLVDHKYYMMIKIPKDFSENATTLLNDNPTPAEIEFIPNVGTNFLAAQIGEKAVDQVKNDIADELTKTYAESIFENMEKMADGYQSASDGATQLHEGINKVDDGAEKLQNHLSDLAKSSITFKEGILTAKKGSDQLVSGMNELNGGFSKMKSGQEELLNGSIKLEKGSAELTDGLKKSLDGIKAIQSKMPGLLQGSANLETGASDLSENMKNWNTGFKQYTTSQQEALSDLTSELQSFATTLSPEQQQQLMAILEASSKKAVEGQQASAKLTQAADQLSAGAIQISEGASNLHAGHLQLNGGVDELAVGGEDLLVGGKKLHNGQKELSSGLSLFGSKITEMKDGSNQLLTGNTNLDAGLGELASGSIKLEDGTEKLADGSKDLTNGASKLVEGSEELKSKLGDAAKETENINGNDKVYNFLANPVHMTTEKINDVLNYGSGFTPYFLSLGLFVGALLFTIVFPLRDPAGVPKSGFSWFIGKFGVAMIAVVLQSLLVDLVLLKGLDLKVQSIPLFLLFSILASITFMSIIQFLVTTLSDVGRFIAIIFLVFQLTTSAGTFPLELIPGFLQHFNAWLPMTYTVSGFRTVISNHDLSFMWHNVGALLVFAAIPLAGTITFFMTQFKKKYQIKTTDQVLVSN